MLEQSKFRVVAIGEVLWDVFPSGPRFGGAPANFACSLAEIAPQTASVSMVSAIGRDELGEQAVASLKSRLVDTTEVQQLAFPTGSVTVRLDDKGVASYQFADNTAWDNLQWNSTLSGHAATMDAVCFGTLGQRSQQSRETIEQYLAAVRPNALRIYDINLRAPFSCDDVILCSLKMANVLKLNEEELPVVAKLCEIEGDDASILRSLASRFDYKAIALTRGDRGAMIVSGQNITEKSDVTADVVDTVGAGDAFTAALCFGLLQGIDIEQIIESACQLASFVCSTSGATPTIPDEVKNSLFQ